MALLTPQDITRAGLTPTFAAATVTTGDTFVNDERTFVRVKNASGSAITATATVVRQVDGQVVTARTVTVPATTGDVSFGPFPAGDYNDANNIVTVVCSAVTSVTIAAIRLPRA